MKKSERISKRFSWLYVFFCMLNAAWTRSDKRLFFHSCHSKQERKKKDERKKQLSYSECQYCYFVIQPPQKINIELYAKINAISTVWCVCISTCIILYTYPENIIYTKYCIFHVVVAGKLWIEFRKWEKTIFSMTWLQYFFVLMLFVRCYVKWTAR